MVATTGFWLAPLLLSVPVFSRDTYSYLAQGALLRDGFDPYAVGPDRQPELVAGQRQSDLDDDDGSVRARRSSWWRSSSPCWSATTSIAGTMVLRLCMLPGLVMLIWAAPRLARHVGANGAAALWICVLNPLVIIHLMGGVHNEMLMVGLMMAGIALTFGAIPCAGCQR